MTTPHRATAFLSAFNEIEAFLRDELNAKKSDGFSWMLRHAERKHLVTGDQAADLKEFADLRNAISHGAYRDFAPIAEPLQETVDEIEHIRDLLLHPPLAMEVLQAQEVITVHPDDDVREALSWVRRTTISQFPVYDGGQCTGILTTNTIARWVSADLDDNDHLDARTVREVLEYAENSDRAVFLPRDITAAAALDAMMTPFPEGGLPRAAVITEHGKVTQKPLRVIGGSDIKALLDAS
ncbi:CBS domain-containing protein [Corynebacterium breve]|uniref:CBS domain-containing protein n=1 Tax=Corynebacterium breve TaxID=3049799 RepID=A0ABY8VGZ8_9CORY|nr:CBS domain-containing protein [Corynebacterium breve]WIM68936.1 CBS domain-containing protein [Corynebacterium breve]